MRDAAINRIVLDASIAIAWCFEDEKTAYSEGILDLLASGSQALVPAIWPAEVTNALLMAERRKRITEAQVTHFLDRLTGFDITAESSHIARVFEHLILKARDWKLTTYDASYLELALRHDLPLATLDTDLKGAAEKIGVLLARKHA